MRDKEMVKRTVEQRERRALAGAGQRGPIGQLLPALVVGGRQRPEGARHFGKRQLRKMFRFERGDPVGQSVVGWGHVCEAGPRPRLRRSYMQEVEIILSDFIPR